MCRVFVAMSYKFTLHIYICFAKNLTIYISLLLVIVIEFNSPMQVSYLSASFGIIYVLVKPSVSSTSIFLICDKVITHFYSYNQLRISYDYWFLFVQTYAIISNASSSTNQVCSPICVSNKYLTIHQKASQASCKLSHI